MVDLVLLAGVALVSGAGGFVGGYLLYRNSPNARKVGESVIAQYKTKLAVFEASSAVLTGDAKVAADKLIADLKALIDGLK